MEEQPMTIRRFNELMKPYAKEVETEVRSIVSLLGAERQLQIIENARAQDVSGVWSKYVNFEISREFQGDASAVLRPLIEYAIANRATILRGYFFQLGVVLNRIEQGIYGDARSKLYSMFLSLIEEDLNVDEQTPEMQELLNVHLAKFKLPTRSVDDEGKRRKLGSCANCEAEATHACARCKSTKYCGSVCQTKHWAKHSRMCNQ